MSPTSEEVFEAAARAGGEAYVRALQVLRDWGKSQSALRETPHEGEQTVLKFALSVGTKDRLFFAIYPHHDNFVLFFRELVPTSLQPELTKRLEAIPGVRGENFPKDNPRLLKMGALKAKARSKG